MADITITAASVVKGADARTLTLVAGAAITAGQVVYKDAADNDKVKLADADSATAAIRVPFGVALNGAAAGQPVTVQTDGLITIGGTVAPGVVYLLSDNAGGIMPAADQEAGDYTSIIGVGASATEITLHLFSSGHAVV